MSDKTCVMDGAPFGALDLEYTCIVCARAVCANHSTKDRMNPSTGEAGRACERCVGQTIEGGDIETYVAYVFRELKRHQDDAVRPVSEAVAAAAVRSNEISATSGAISLGVRDIGDRQAKDASTTHAALNLVSTQLCQLTAIVNTLEQQQRKGFAELRHGGSVPSASSSQQHSYEVEVRAGSENITRLVQGLAAKQVQSDVPEAHQDGRRPAQSLPSWWLGASALGWIVAATLAAALLLR